MRERRRITNYIQRIPLRWRLALLSLALLALLLSGLGMAISLIANQVLVTNEVNVLQNEAQVAIKGVMKGVPQPERPFELSNSFFPTELLHPSSDFEQSALSFQHALANPNMGTHAAILTPQGGTLLPNPSTPYLPPSKVRAILQTTNWYLLMNDARGQRQLVVLIPLVRDYQTVGILQISTSTAPIDHFLAPFRLSLILGIIGALCLAMTLTFPLVSVALRPLVEIERTSRRIARGELSVRIASPPTNDEIGRLARSFNHMVAQLESAFKKQKRFVADVSHELRTPLTALSGSLEMLMIGADQGDPEASRRLARGMYTEVQRMNRMVEDLLVLTRLDDGKIALRKEQVDAGALLWTVHEQAGHLARGQELLCEVEADLAPVCADKDRLQQVLLNLTDNALKFTPADGKVELQARSGQRNLVVLTVSDTGQGIDPAALPHVFDRFYRADFARSRSPQQAGGSGLGLAIAKELVDAQGGRIEIASTPGHGTTVTLLFPAMTRTTLPDAPPPTLPPEPMR